jgi:hypothetical protein
VQTVEDYDMDVEDWLRNYGLDVERSRLNDVRSALAAESKKEALEQGDGDTHFMRLCCVQLFRAGLLEDVLNIWDAKISSMDAYASIDVQLLCGAGLENTKAFLARQSSALAREALEKLEKSELCGDFRGFSVEDYAKRLEAFYASG